MMPIINTQPTQQTVRQTYKLEIKNPECATAAIGCVIGSFLGMTVDGCCVGCIAGCLCRHSLTSISVYERDIKSQSVSKK